MAADGPIYVKSQMQMRRIKEDSLIMIYRKRLNDKLLCIDIKNRIAKPSPLSPLLIIEMTKNAILKMLY